MIIVEHEEDVSRDTAGSGPNLLLYADMACMRLTGMAFHIPNGRYYRQHISDAGSIISRDGHEIMEEASRQCKIPAAFMKEYQDRCLPIKATYVPTSQRSISEETQLAIGKKVAELAEKHDYSLSSNFNSAIKNDIVEMIRQEYMRKDHRVNVEANRKLGAEINSRWYNFIDAVEVLCTSIASGTCENPVKAAKDFEEKQW